MTRIFIVQLSSFFPSFFSLYLFPRLPCVFRRHTSHSSRRQHGNCPEMLRQFRRETQFGGMGLGGINSIGLFYYSEGTEERLMLRSYGEREREKEKKEGRKEKMKVKR